MPRVEKRTARKDYPAQGIKAGDTYYYTKLRLQRGGIIKRSLKPFKPSELTNSEFKSAFLAVGEAWDESDKTADDIREAASAIGEIGDDCQSKFDNMPEGLQQGDTGQMLETRASECEGIRDELDNLAEELDGLDQPTEDDFTVTDPDDPDADPTNEDGQTFADSFAEYEQEVERIRDEATDQINAMPD